MEGRREKLRKLCDNGTSALSKQNKEKDQNDIEAVQFHIPDHIILEHILPRLPVETLLRFKSVSKNWYISLSSPYFAKTHLQFSSSHHHFFLHDEQDGSFLLSYDEEHGLKEFVDLGEDIIPGHIVYFVGSCNGILCLELHDYDESDDENLIVQYAVCNPATRECRQIDLPPKGTADFRGFGYAPLIDDYKIVSIYKVDGGKLDVYVFLLKANNWKKIGVLDNDYGLNKGQLAGLLVNNALYWCSCEYKRPSVVHIAGFHLESEEMKAIATFECPRAYVCSDLYEIKGCLSLRCVRPNESSDIWTLKQHCDSNSCWVPLFSFAKTLSLVGFSVTGKCLLAHEDEWKLMFFDPSHLSEFMFIDPDDETPEDAQIVSFNFFF